MKKELKKKIEAKVMDLLKTIDKKDTQISRMLEDAGVEPSKASVFTVNIIWPVVIEGEDPLKTTRKKINQLAKEISS